MDNLISKWVIISIEPGDELYAKQRKNELIGMRRARENIAL